jgi:hypothetical protein
MFPHLGMSGDHVTGCTGQGGRGSRRFSGWRSSTSRSYCGRGRSALHAPTTLCGQWSSGCCGSSSSAGSSSTALRGCGAPGAVAACSSPFPAVAEASVPRVRRRSRCCGPSGCGRSCSLRWPTVTSSSPFRAGCARCFAVGARSSPNSPGPAPRLPPSSSPAAPVTTSDPASSSVTVFLYRAGPWRRLSWLAPRGLGDTVRQGEVGDMRSRPRSGWATGGAGPARQPLLERAPPAARPLLPGQQALSRRARRQDGGNAEVRVYLSWDLGDTRRRYRDD